MATTNTFACVCCASDYVRRLKDCCTDEFVDLAISSGVAAGGTTVSLKYGGKCYYPSGDPVLLADAVSAGWSILNIGDVEFLAGCGDSSCSDHYSKWTAYCGNYESDLSNPLMLLTGPCPTAADYTAPYNYALIGGRWYFYEGDYSVCAGSELPASDPEGTLGEYILQSGCYSPDTLSEDLPCCNKCVTGGTFPNETVEYHLRQKCVSISGMTFSGCGTNMTGLPDWDGKLFCSGDSQYNTAPSTGAEPCTGNWDTCNGYVPGTTVGLPGTNVLHFDCPDQTWYIDLAFVSYSKTGDDGSDPTGTYNRIGAGSCGAPATLTVS